MTGLNTKNSDIIDLITATNNKLDAILTALGAPPPTATVTLEDIKEVLDNINNGISDLKSYLVDTMGERLPDSIFTMWNMEREILIASGFILTNTEAIAQTNTKLDSLINILTYSLTNIGVDPGAINPEYTGYLFSSLDWLGRISGAMGLPVEANNRDVIELLAKIADRPESEIGSGLAPYDICSDAYISSGMILVPYNVLAVTESIVFAVFPDPPPSGMEFGTVFGIGVDFTELHNTSGWSGWRIYVASSANNFALNSEDISTVLNRYPTNVWLDLSFLTTNLSVFVGGDDSLRVYLCGGAWGPGSGGGGPWGGGSGSGGTFPPICYTFTEEQHVLKDTFAGARYIPDWEIYGISVISNETADNEVWIQGNWSGWTWQTTSSVLQIVIELTPGDITIETSMTGTMPTSTDPYLVAFVSEFAAFDLEFCQPETPP